MKTRTPLLCRWILTISCGLVPPHAAAQQASASARDRALEHLGVVEHAARERQGPDGDAWRGRIKTSEPDLERSLDWLLQNGQGDQALRFADAMVPFWTAFGEVPHARQRLEAALATPAVAAPSPLRAKALYDAGLLAFRMGDEMESRKLNEESLAIARRLDDKSAAAAALIGLSRIALRHHDYAAVRHDANEALSLRQALNDLPGEMSVVHLLAAAALMSDDHANALKYYELALGIAGKDGNKSGVAGELMNLGFVHVHRHDPEWALRLVKESVSIFRELQAQDGLAYDVSALAAIAAERRDAATAATLYGALDSAMQKLGIVLDPDDQLDVDRYTTLAREQLGAATFDGLRSQGRRLSVDDALALGLGKTKS
jgi:tetratricopeptide (TPR) repeat protein